jgi:hypothetical protein
MLKKILKLAFVLSVLVSGVSANSFWARLFGSGHCLYFLDDLDETVYQACMPLVPFAANATVSSRVTLASGRGLNLAHE